jgi:prepilin-type N-terminal cleavage/methylation domain-containing protein
MAMRKQRGFTLIEIAIVLVIIGLLLGGVLKGQELITSARVRHLTSTQDGVKAAYFGFLDRYRALPGDYSGAQANIPNCTGCQNGNNDGQIKGIAGGVVEPISAWEHLSKAGFVTGSYVYGATVAAGNTPVNPYGSYVELVYDAVYLDSGTPPARHNLKTGANISSDILAEVDRKIDDGMANGGQFRFSAFSGATNTGDVCASTAADATKGQWKSALTSPNCGGTSLF